MGWWKRAGGCALWLTVAAPAWAGERIAYPPSNQMYALIAGDVAVAMHEAKL